MRLSVTFALSALLAIPVAIEGSASPSFDCAKAGTESEHAICDSSTLSALDRALADAYRAARAGAAAAVHDRIRAEQIAWLRDRDACGADPACLAARMQERVAALRNREPGGAAGAEPVAEAGISGVYCLRGGADAILVETRGDTALFAVSSWQANGHHCGTPTLEARRSGDAWVAQDGGCTLRLSTGPSGVVLTAAPFDACKARYCGARAAMERFVFPSSSRRPLPAPAAGLSLVETDLCR